MRRIDVVLPLPFGPRKPKISPRIDPHRQVDDDVLVAEALVEAVDVDDRIVPSPSFISASRTPAGPDAACVAFSGDGRASTMNTSLLRVSLL